MGRCINHSEQKFNAKLVMIWNAGVPVVLVVAVRDISKGEQVLIDYQENFWKYNTNKEQKTDKFSILNYTDEDYWSAAEKREFFKRAEAVQMSEKQLKMFL